MIFFLAEQYKMKDLGSCGQFTGIKLEQNRNKRTITLFQKVYLEKSLEHANISNSKPVHCPIISGIDFRKNLENLADKEFIRLYQSHVSTYMWAYICACLDLGFAVSTLSRFLSNSTLEHMAIVQWVYQYLQATKNMKIVYCNGFTKYPRLKVYTNADWAGNKETQRSTSAYVTMLSSCSISWSLKKQMTVAQSSTKTEFIAASEAT